MQESNDKLTKLMRLAVGSDSEGEQLAALRRILRILAEDGKTAADLSLSVPAAVLPAPGFRVPDTFDEHVWTAPWQRFRARAARMQDQEFPNKSPSPAETATAASRAAYARARMQAQAPQENPFTGPPKVKESKEEETPPPLTEAEEYAKEGVPLRVSDTVNNTPLSFGKYEGMSPLAATAKDPQYARWAIDNLKAEIWVQYFKAAVIRRKHRPFESIKMENLYG